MSKCTNVSWIELFSLLCISSSPSDTSISFKIEININFLTI